MRTKINLLVISILISSAVFAQEKYSKPIFVGKEKKAITGDEVNFTKAIDYSVPSTFFDEAPTIPGNVVGYTFYDFMTNGSLGKGLIRWNDNTMATILMSAIDSTSLTTTRGNYYNFYKNNIWKDTTNFWRKIEAYRRGRGQLASWSDKTILFVSFPGIHIYQNVGTWDNPFWSGSIFYSSYSGSILAMDDDGQSYWGIWILGIGSKSIPDIIYSTDTGATWITKSLRAYVPPSDTELIKKGYFSLSIEEHGLSSKKGNVAVAGFKTSGNVYVFISSNKGANWTYKKLDDAAKRDSSFNTLYPFDSSFFPAKRVKMLGVGYCDGTGDVMIDKNGVVHVAWGTYELGYRIIVDALGNPIRDPQGKLQRQFFITDYTTTGIWYWNSNFAGEPIQVVKPTSTMVDTTIADKDSITHVWTLKGTGINMSAVGMPSFAQDIYGNTYIVFQGYKSKDTMSLSNGYVFLFGHVYIAGTYNGNNWSNPKDIYGENIMKEDVCFPFTAEYADSNIHVIVMNDNIPGTWVLNNSSGHPLNKKLYIHTAIPVFISNVNDDKIIFDYKLEQNYPNPFNPITRIKYSVGKNEKVTLKVFDILGSEVATLVDQIKEPGNYELELDGGNLSSGVYFYQLISGNFISVKKMILLK